MKPATVQAWLDELDSPRRKQAEELARIVAAVDDRLERAVKWGRLTFTAGGDWHHWVCQVAAPAKGAKLIFHKGALLEDPEGLLTGSARYLREVPAGTVFDRPDAVADLVRSALAHQTDM